MFGGATISIIIHGLLPFYDVQDIKYNIKFPFHFSFLFLLFIIYYSFNLFMHEEETLFVQKGNLHF